MSNEQFFRDFLKKQHRDAFWFNIKHNWFWLIVTSIALFAFTLWSWYGIKMPSYNQFEGPGLEVVPVVSARVFSTFAFLGSVIALVMRADTVGFALHSVYQRPFNNLAILNDIMSRVSKRDAQRFAKSQRDWAEPATHETVRHFVQRQLAKSVEGGSLLDQQLAVINQHVDRVE